jgi:hypothetical protein
MNNLKHIGRLKNNGAKVLVAFRTLPGESNYALVIPVSQLSDSYHDSIMKLVETAQAQDAFEFGEIMHIRPFPDGRPMLLALREDQKLIKVTTDSVIMTPNTVDTIELHQLNVLIAEQKNCAVDDLCTFVSGAPKQTEVQDVAQIKDLGRDVGEPNIPQSKAQPLKAKENEVLSDQDLAKSYRSQADSMYKEAARLRKEADALDPPKKKVSKVKETTDAETI